MNRVQTGFNSNHTEFKKEASTMGFYESSIWTTRQYLKTDNLLGFSITFN